MKVIGLTGGSGSGKTTVMQAMCALGAYPIDCDELYHNLLKTDEPLKQALAARYGAQTIDADGAVDRAYLRAQVFADEQARLDLNAITHPVVERAVHDLIAQANRAGYPAAIVDAIALIESGYANFCDATVAVLADETLRHSRIMKRDSFLTEESAWARIRSQKSDDFYRETCDYVIENNGTGQEADRAELAYQVQLLYQTILSQEGN